MQRIHRQVFMVEIQRASAIKMKVPSPELQLLEGVSSPSVDRTSQNILSHNPYQQWPTLISLNFVVSNSAGKRLLRMSPIHYATLPTTRP